MANIDSTTPRPTGGAFSHPAPVPFDRFGVMLDCSRNAVPKPDTLKTWIDRLARLGYNTLLLYLENTYSLPDEPYFGYLRGGYTAAELRDLDDYAAARGIELTGCIQTLGHLEHTLKWSPYWSRRDTASVLLVDDPGVTALLEKMIRFFADNLRSRRLHVGMDEAHDLGRGRFLDQHGYQPPYDLFQRHLQRVVDLCTQHQLQPMLWSDMIFRMGNPQQSYYDPATRIPDTVRDSMPKQAQWVYWDYEHTDAAFYNDWINRHRQLGVEPVMASGLWVWGGHFWYAHAPTSAAVPACLQACKEQGVREIFFTLWGDDGAYAHLDSALAGLAYAAEYAATGSDHGAADRLRRAVDVNYDAILQLSAIQTSFNPASLFWDDPLLGIYWKNQRQRDPACWPNALRACRRGLRHLPTATEPVDFDHGRTLFRYLTAVIRLRLDLEAAYAARDRTALQQLRRRVKAMPRQLERCHQTLRRQWMQRNRPHGFETLQHRIGARKERWLELDRRLDDLIAGRCETIAEWDECPNEAITLYTRWRDVCASGIA
jgi:hexosaminidase